MCRASRVFLNTPITSRTPKIPHKYSGASLKEEPKRFQKVSVHEVWRSNGPPNVGECEGWDDWVGKKDD